MICLVDGLRVLNLNLLSCKPRHFLCEKPGCVTNEMPTIWHHPRTGLTNLTKCCLDFWRFCWWWWGWKPLGNCFNSIHPKKLGGEYLQLLLTDSIFNCFICYFATWLTFGPVLGDGMTCKNGNFPGLIYQARASDLDGTILHAYLQIIKDITVDRWDSRTNFGWTNSSNWEWKFKKTDATLVASLGQKL